MLTLIKNIKELVQVETGQPKLRAMGKEMARVETVKDAYLLVEDGKIKAFGPMDEWKAASGMSKANGTYSLCASAPAGRCRPTSTAAGTWPQPTP